MAHMRRLFVVLLLAPVLLIVGCAEQPATEVEEDPFVYGLTLQPSGIDPHINASAELGIPLRSVYDTLVYRDSESLSFVPGLASEWSVSGNGLVYTFTLREDVTFHDGTPFNAEAVRVNIERMIDPQNNSAKAAQLLGPVQSVNVLSDFQVELILSEPFVPLLDGLSQPYTGMASPTALAERDAQSYQFHQVGTGPYRFVEYVFDSHILLERNPDYAWAPEVTNNPGIPTVERIYFRFFEDTTSRALALETDDADVMGELLPADARRLTESNNIQLAAVNVPGQPYQYMLNTSRFPTNSLAFRQALLYGANRQEIVSSVFQGYSPIAYGPLTSSTLYFNPNVDGRYAFDPEQAEALANSTGWIDSDDDGFRDRDGEPVVVTLVTPPWGLGPDIAILLEEQWENNLNIEVIVRQVASFPMLSEQAAEGEYNAIAINFSGLDPSLLNAFYGTAGPLNWSRFSDPNLDVLLEQAVTVQDEALRQELYYQIQTQIMDQAVVFPIREQVNLNGVQPGISGLSYDAYGWFPYLTEIGFGS